MFQLFELDDKNIIPSLPPYDSAPWYISVKNVLQDYLTEYFGDRVLMTTRAVKSLIVSEATRDEILNRFGTDSRRTINLLFNANNLKYERIFNVINEKYDPLWNVDGVETLIYTRDNTGTVYTDGSNTGTQATQGGNTGTQTTQGTNTGTVGTIGSAQTVTEHENETTDSSTVTADIQKSIDIAGANTGTVGTQGTNTGTETTADSTTKTSVHKATTFDSQTYVNTGEDVDTNGGQVIRTDNLAHGETRTDNLSHTENTTEESTEATSTQRGVTDEGTVSATTDNTETRTDNLAHSETRTDNLAHTETRTDNLAHTETRTDDLMETYSETRKRTGNIGVTKSQDLLLSELDVARELNFTEIVARDIANAISYSVY